jgi:hypothetical protein
MKMNDVGMDGFPFFIPKGWEKQFQFPTPALGRVRVGAKVKNRPSTMRTEDLQYFLYSLVKIQIK